MSLGPHRAWTLVLLLLAPATLRAQGEDAVPLPPGVLRFGVAGVYTQWDAELRDGGATPIGAPFSIPLNPGSFAPLRPLRDDLNRFLRATDARTGGDSALTADGAALALGTLDVAATASRTEVPFRVQLGVTRRLAVRAGVGLGRERVEVQGVALAAGALGENPNAAANREAFAAIDPAFGDLGASPFLPLVGSPLGQELSRRVSALGGPAVQLPDSAVDADEIRALLLADPLQNATLRPDRVWRVEAAQAGVRFQLLGAGLRFPAGQRGVRAALSVDGRIPVAPASERNPLFSGTRAGATPEVDAALRADAVLGTRLWMSVGAEYTLRAAGEVPRRVGLPGEPFPAAATLADLRVDPGDRAAAEVIPRFQLTDAISLGAVYGYAREAADRYPDLAGDPAPFFAAGARSSHSVGVGARYTTVPAWLRGSGVLPLEAELLYRTVVAGSGGVPDAGRMELRGRVYQPLWGR